MFRLPNQLAQIAKGRLLTFGLVGAALGALGGYRVLFNTTLLGRGQESLLADIIFTFSYINIIAIIAGSGSIAIYQRLTGQALGRGNTMRASAAFTRGAAWCLFAPLIVDTLVKLLGLALGKGLLFPWSLPFVASIGLYNFIKPLCFTFGRQRVYSAIEIGSLLIGTLFLLVVPQQNVIHGILILCAPQAALGIFGLIKLSSISRSSAADCDLNYRNNAGNMGWATIGTTSSMGFIYILNMLGRGQLSDAEYAVYGTVLSLIAALNIFDRSINLILLPKFTLAKGALGESATARMLNRIFLQITFAALPLWFVFGAVPPIVAHFSGLEVPERIYPASLILIVSSFVSLILNPLVSYNVGAGRFRTPQIGSLTGACFGIIFALLTLEHLGSQGLALSLLIAVSINYIFNAAAMAQDHLIRPRTLALSFATGTAAISSYLLASFVFVA